MESTTDGRTNKEVSPQALMIIAALAAFIGHSQEIGSSIISPFVQSDLGLSRTALGFAVGTFSIFQLVGITIMSIVVMRAGTYLGCAFAVGLSSVATGIIGLARNMTSLIMSIGLQGLTSGGILPWIMQTVASLFPPKLHGTAVGIINAAINLAPLSVAPVIAALGSRIGWRAALMTIPILGLIWVLIWIKMRPRSLSLNLPPSRSSNVPLWELALSVILIQPVWPLLTIQFPFYLSETHNMDIRTLLNLISFSAAAGALVAGLSSDGLIRAGRSIPKSRIAVAIIAMLFIPSYILATVLSNKVMILLVIVVSAAAYWAWITIVYSAALDASPNRAGLIIAVAVLSTEISKYFVIAPEAGLISAIGFPPVAWGVAATSLLALLCLPTLGKKISIQNSSITDPEIEGNSVPSPEFAGFGQRAVAYLIDVVIGALFVWILHMVLTVTGDNIQAIFTILAAAVIPWIYFAGFESSALQATIGKSLLEIIVTDEFGNRLSFGQATNRYFARVLSIPLGIGYLYALLNQQKRTLHDFTVGSLVIRRMVV